MPYPSTSSHLKNMRKLALLFAAIASALLVGCASAPSGTSGTNSSAAAPSVPAETTAARIAAPVKIPAASSRKIVLVMTGPQKVLESKDWPDMKREWKDTFAEHAKAAGIAFSFADTLPAPGTEEGTLLLVNVADYRIVGIGMRILFGVMTGNAYIDAQVAFNNLRGGSKFGEQQYNTSSSAWGGVFAKVTPQQVDQIASGVFAEFKSAK